MSQRISPHTWVILGLGVALVAGFALLLAFLGREPGGPAPMITPGPRQPITNGRAGSRAGHPHGAAAHPQPVHFAPFYTRGRDGEHVAHSDTGNRDLQSAPRPGPASDGTRFHT